MGLITRVFAAFDDVAAYVTADLTRAKAITTARDDVCVLTDDYSRADLHAVRVYMREVSGEEASEFFWDEYERGWIECPKTTRGAFPMWKVEPR